VNSLKRRKEAFKSFLAYCRQHELSAEFWDVDFCQGSSKNLSTNEKNKEKQYRDAFRAFMDSEDAEFAAARDDMMFLNTTWQGAPRVSLFGMCLSGALSEGAWKIINRLTEIKFLLRPTDITISRVPQLSGCTLTLGRLVDAYHYANHV